MGCWDRHFLGGIARHLISTLIIGKSDRLLHLLIDNGLGLVESKLVLQNLDRRLTLSLRLNDRSDVQFLGVVNAGFFEDTLDATALAAAKAWAEDLAPAGDSAGVQDLAFLGDDLVMEVAGDRIPLPG